MISVVIPCYNEKDVLKILYDRLTPVAESWGEPFEVVLVDDGSGEQTWEAIREIRERDPRWKVVRLARNFGHQIAVSAGLHYAGGDCAVIIDADLQDPPEQIRHFLEKWREGYDVVYAVRAKRKENFLKRACYRLFYRLLKLMADIDLPLDSGDFCLMDRKVVELLKSMPERNRYVRGLRAWVGFRQTGIEYEREARAAGKPQYTLRKLVRLALDGIYSFTTIPLRLATYLGFTVSLIAIIGAVFTFFQRVFNRWFALIGLGTVPGFATTVIAVLFLGGIQLICLGILGQYLGRIYEEVKMRPLWTVRDLLGFDRQSGPPRAPGRDYRGDA